MGYIQLGFTCTAVVWTCITCGGSKADTPDIEPTPDSSHPHQLGAAVVASHPFPPQTGARRNEGDPAATPDVATPDVATPDVATPDVASTRPGAKGLSADIGFLCAAVNRDYVDGTLSATFRGLSPRSPQGQAILHAAAQADQPGRYLLAQAHRLSASLRAPGLAACNKLADYIDDVE
ncbi:MAG: hypothetical protein V3V08_09690 [Nannocystaceae bacterium]